MVRWVAWSFVNELGWDFEDLRFFMVMQYDGYINRENVAMIAVRII